jgi:hypothetical protein
MRTIIGNQIKLNQNPNEKIKKNNNENDKKNSNEKNQDQIR